MADTIPFPDASRHLAVRGGLSDLLYGALFQPIKTFRAIGSAPYPGNRPLFYAFLSVLLISSLTPAVQMAHTGGKPANLIIYMPLSAVGGIITWIWIAALVALSAYALIGRSRFRTFLVLSALSMLPTLLLGPISLLNVGPAGLLLCAIPALMVWIWTSLLFVLAIMNAYDITADRAFILLCLPVLLVLTCLGGGIGLIGSLIQLRIG